MEKGWVFTITMTYGGALLALANPFIGFLVYVCFAIIRPDDLWPWSVPHGNYSRIVAIAMLIGWVIHGFGNWKLGKAWPILLCFTFFWLWSIVSLSFAWNFDTAEDYVERLTKIFIPFVVGITLVNSVQRMKTLAWVILICHAYLAYEFNLAYFSGYNRVWQQGFSYMDNNGVGIDMDTVIGFAFFLGIGAPHLWQKGFALGSALLMLHTVLLSFSRGGMLGLIVTGAVSFALIPKTLKHYVVLALVVAVGLQLAGKEVRERFMMSFEDSSQRDAAAEERLQLWKACVDVMKTKPMVGCGPAHWPLVAESYGFPPGKAAHSTWMQTGAELGLPALAALMSFFVILVWRLWPFARNKAGNYEPWFQDSARMVIASMAGFGVSAQFVTVSLLEPAYYVALVGACLLKLASNQTVQHPYVPVHADKYRSMHPDPMALIPR